MTRTTWDEQELQFLRVLARGASISSMGQLANLADDIGLTDDEMGDVLRDLNEEGYISGEFIWRWGGGLPAKVVGLRVAPAGRRMLGLWPTEDDGGQAAKLAEAFIEALNEAAVNAPHAEQTKLRQVASWFADKTTDLAVQIAAAAITKSAGFA